MSTTSLPPDLGSAAPSRPALIKPPVLASDILREEVAPIAPGQRAVRIWLSALAAAFVLVAIATRFGFGPPSPSVFSGSLATAVVALIAAVLPAPYAARACLAVTAGLVPLALGALGEGPLAAIGHEGGLSAMAGLALVTLLPGALFFRGRYRAFRAARIILAAAMATALPAMILLGLGTLSDGGELVTRIFDGAALAASLTAFFGFMGDETTGGCTGWGILLIVIHAARLGIHTLGTESELYGPWGFVVGATGEFVAAALIAFAVFQLLAVAFAREARKVDVHRIVGPGAEDREPLTSITTE
jgi:hypothetical protein